MSGQSCMIYLSTGSQVVQVKKVVLVHSTTLFIPSGVSCLLYLLYEGSWEEVLWLLLRALLLYQVYPLFVPSILFHQSVLRSIYGWIVLGYFPR